MDIPFEYTDHVARTHQESYQEYTVPDANSQAGGTILQVTGAIGNLLEIPGSGLISTLGSDMKAPYAVSQTRTAYDGLEEVEHSSSVHYEWNDPEHFDYHNDGREIITD